jgi:CBS domain-containing protein
VFCSIFAPKQKCTPARLADCFFHLFSIYSVYGAVCHKAAKGRNVQPANGLKKENQDMQFTVRDWMMDLIVFVEPDTPVTDVLATMRRRYINSVIVNKTKASPDFGILTSTDICDKIVAQDRDPSQVKVSEIMTSPLITIRNDMPVSECARIMKQNKIHHLPVVDENNNLVGMISATDFLVVAEAMGRSGERALR